MNALLTLQTVFTRNERFSLMSAGSLLLLAIVVMGIISLTVLNGKATKGYLLNQLETERQELIVDGEVTDMLILRARSLASVEEQVTGMVKPSNGDIAFVAPITVVAQR